MSTAIDHQRAWGEGKTRRMHAGQRGERVLVDERVAHFADDGGWLRILQLEDGFDDGHFGRRGVEAAKGAPVVDDEATANHVRATVHSAGLRTRAVRVSVRDGSVRALEGGAP